MNATVHAFTEYRPFDRNGRYRIQIVDSNETATTATEFTSTADGGVLTYEGDVENVVQAVIPSTLSFTWIAETQAQIDRVIEIATSEAGRYGVRFLYNPSYTGESFTVQWVGTLVNDQLTVADTLPQPVQFTATDDLGYLSQAPYLDSNGDRFTGRASARDHLLNCIGLLRASWYWQYFITIAGTDYYSIVLTAAEDLAADTYGSEGAAFDVLEEVTIPHTAFYDVENKAKPAYEVLEQIALYFNASAFFNFTQASPRLYFVPLGAYQQYAINQTQLTGHTWRSDGTKYGSSFSGIGAEDLNNTASIKRRKAGGYLSFSKPYKEVTRQVRWNDQQPVAQQPFNDSDGFSTSFYTWYTHEAPTSAGDRLRLVFSNYFAYDGAGSSSIYFDTTGASGAGPTNYAIARLRIRVQIRLNRDGGTASHLRRSLTAGGQVPVYETWSGLTTGDLPIYYQDIYPNEEVTWDDTGTSRFYVQATEPFDCSVNQTIEIPFDVVTPPISSDADSISIRVEAEYLLPDNSEALLFTDNSEYLQYRLDNYGGTVRLYPFDQFGTTTGVIYKAVNDGNQIQRLTAGDLYIHDQAQLSSYGGVEWRQPNGTYSLEVFGFTSSQESTSVLRSGQLVVNELARFYASNRRVFEATARGPYALGGMSDLWKLTEGVTNYWYKPLSLTWNTGRTETTITGIEVARESTAPVEDPQNLVGGGDNTNVDPNTGERTGVSVRAFEASAAGSVVAYNTAVANAERSSQVGENVVTIDDAGAFQEVADGNDGNFLTTNGQGSISWKAQTLVLGTISARVTSSYIDNYYYGNSVYGFNYPIWSSITFTDQQGNPYSRQIPDDNAHSGFICTHAATAILVQGTIRNDTNTEDLTLKLVCGDRPNGSAGNIQLTVLDTTSVTVNAVDRHYNFTLSGGAVGRGKLVFLGIGRGTGAGTLTTYINFSATITIVL